MVDKPTRVQGKLGYACTGKPKGKQERQRIRSKADT
jgi:hypothetical protein